MKTARINIRGEDLDFWWDKGLHCAQYDVMAEVIANRLSDSLGGNACNFIVALYETAKAITDLEDTFRNFKDDYQKGDLVAWRNRDFGGELYWRFLSFSDNTSWRSAAAKKIRFTQDQWGRVLRDVPWVISAAAANPYVEIALLRSLARNPSEQGMWNLAGNPNLPADLQELLAREGSSSVKAQIARRKILKKEVLEILVGDKDFWVQVRLAERTELPEDIAKMVSEGDDIDVLNMLARKSRHRSILKVLKGNQDVYISEAAEKRIKQLDNLRNKARRMTTIKQGAEVEL